MITIYKRKPIKIETGVTGFLNKKLIDTISYQKPNLSPKNPISLSKINDNLKFKNIKTFEKIILGSNIGKQRNFLIKTRNLPPLKSRNEYEVSNNVFLSQSIGCTINSLCENQTLKKDISLPKNCLYKNQTPSNISIGHTNSKITLKNFSKGYKSNKSVENIHTKTPVKLTNFSIKKLSIDNDNSLLKIGSGTKFSKYNFNNLNIYSNGGSNINNKNLNLNNKKSIGTSNDSGMASSNPNSLYDSIIHSNHFFISKNGCESMKTLKKYKLNEIQTFKNNNKATRELLSLINTKNNENHEKELSNDNKNYLFSS